tara:strand:+ start:685 stop:1167 length:483 start_codon:yes stop_codon:yes gene_type:complete
MLKYIISIFYSFFKGLLLFYFFLLGINFLNFLRNIYNYIYYYSLNYIEYIFLFNKIKYNDLSRFLNNDVILNYQDIQIIGYMENIFLYDYYFYKEIYILLRNKDYKKNKYLCIYLNFKYIKMIEYINDKKSKYLFELISKYRKWNNYYNNDILKEILDYI